MLVGIGGGSVARLNRAVAIGERDGPDAALAEVDAIDDLRRYPYWWASRAELLARLGRRDDAAACDEALALPLAAPQRAFIEERRRDLTG